MPNVELTDYFEAFDTPFGGTAPFKLLRIGGQNVLRTAMHGMWDHGGGQGSRPRTPWLAAKQVGWVLEQAGGPVGDGRGIGGGHTEAGQARGAAATLEHHDQHGLHDVFQAGG